MLATVRRPGAKMAPISSTSACRQLRCWKSGAKHRITAAKRAGRRGMAAVLWPGRPSLAAHSLRHLNPQNWPKSSLVVHPLNECDIWRGSDAEPTRRAMPPAAAPDERVLVLVPVGGGTLDGLLDLGPGIEAPAFEGQRAQHLPPRLDEVEVGRVFRLEHELPARVRQSEQQYVHAGVDIEVVEPRVDPLGFRPDPGLGLAQEVDPVRGCAALVGRGEGSPRGWLQGAEHIARDIASAVVD